MRERRDSLTKSVATIGLAVTGPVAFFTGLFTAARVPAGVPGVLLVVFLVATLLSVLFVAVYLLAWQREVDDAT